MFCETARPSVFEPLIRKNNEETQTYTEWLDIPKKRRFCGFGYLPLWSECVPLSGPGKLKGPVDWAGIGVNITAGLIMGVREALGGIISASMVFSSSDVPEVSAMLQFGISMTLYTMSLGVLWYAIFGRLQYGYGTQQDLICILQAQLAARVAALLENDPGKIPATVFVIICLSSVLTGVVSIAVGKFALGTAMLMIPKPVVNGFLGAIGIVVVQAGLKTASGVKFHHFWPDAGWRSFCSSQDRLWQIACMFGHTFCIRNGPMLVHWLFRTERHPGRRDAVKRYAGLACQLLPLVMFFASARLLGFTMQSLADHGWTYPSTSDRLGPSGFWTAYKTEDVDLGTVWNVIFSDSMVALVAMAILCTMLGALAITGRFNEGPEGDPSPDEPLDFNAELTTVGAASVLLGLTGGNLIFHKFSVIQLREDGGTHRIAVLTIALVSGSLFWFGFPIGSYVPKWFLGGLFLHTGCSFLKKTLLSYRSLAACSWHGIRFVSPQYGISTCCVLTALFYSPTIAIIVGMALSVVLFLVDGMTTSPVSSVVDGKHVVSRTKRPWWEMKVLNEEGDRIRLVYLQGQLFFGSTLNLTANLSAAAAYDRIEFMILSFTQVPLVDPSAAEHLKVAKDKLRKRGCHVIFCRMNKQVFDTLTAAGALSLPSPESLRLYRQLGWNFPNLEAQSANDEHPDAFLHETDALDFCNALIIDARGVAPPQLPLDVYNGYRAATHNPGTRLSEEVFEKMNDLKPGILARIRPLCEVRRAEMPGTVLSDVLPQMEQVLCFIFKGALSTIRVVPEVNGSRPLHMQRATNALRAGKKLVVRSPPGHVAGISTFFRFHDADVDQQMQPKLIVSSHCNPPAEIWILRRLACNGIPGWKDMPDDDKGHLERMFCVQFADALNHSNLKER